MDGSSGANGTELVDDVGREFRLAWSTEEVRRAAREVKRGARVGVIKNWGIAGGVEWPGWTAFPPRGSTERAELWLTDVVNRVGSDVEISLWKGDDGSVLLAWDACRRRHTLNPTGHPPAALRAATLARICRGWCGTTASPGSARRAPQGS